LPPPAEISSRLLFAVPFAGDYLAMIPFLHYWPLWVRVLGCFLLGHQWISFGSQDVVTGEYHETEKWCLRCFITAATTKA